MLTCVVEIIADRSGEDVSDLDFLTFRDLDQRVRDDVDRSGHVCDVRTGTLREVVPAE